jgi:hypothetical protein
MSYFPLCQDRYGHQIMGISKPTLYADVRQAHSFS